MIADDLRHADLQADGTPVTDEADVKAESGLCRTKDFVVYVGRPRGKCASIE
jgi:hypothetical protein